MYAVEFENVTKEFPGIIANKDVSFKVKKGTIHALIGENGAGKSTLMSILFGLYSPTRGAIKINEKYVNIKDPNHANDLGIGMVHQHFKLVGIYSNLQNIVLGSEFSKHGFLDLDLASEKIKTIQEQFNLKFNLNDKSGKSSVPVQQKVEIMKMLYRDNDILIFDEPTAVLTDEEIHGLLETMKLFKKQGKTIIFITHKLKEIKEVADTATVLRHGKVILNCNVAETSIEQMAHAMVGDNLVAAQNSNHSFDEELVLDIQNVSTGGKKPLTDINLKVHKGEILAIAGVAGNGQTQVEYLVSGLLKAKKGKILMKARNKQNNLEMMDVTNLNVGKRSKLNLSYIPTDRHKHGLVLDYSINMNTVLRRLWDKTYSKFLVFKDKAIKKQTLDIIEKFDVRGARNGISQSRSLSGGNQQKFIVGREIMHDHELIVVMQPTRGLDVGAIKNIHEKLIEEKNKGKGILLISYELDEVLSLADTIAVINNGKIINVSPADKITRQEIGMFMSDSVSTEQKGKELNDK
ncbi:ABC transporter ATP-binding protein [[Mycoplasma] gypis]|uniref:ABC transporter ATP-binding protein n=1 Tax=[Mycoplasma] gypis TaxID=92404 RepID=A0ABZ2RNG4_9BACT|nr:ABC transporter ATP-binding protein [[Mycoplasma] gypis]